MKTDDLVHLLAQGPIAVAPAAVARRQALALGAGGLAAFGLMLGLLGVNPDLRAATGLSGFWTKVLFAAALCGTGTLAMARLARPGASLGGAPAGIALALVLMAALAAAQWLAAEPDARHALLFGSTWRACPWWIALLSTPLGAALTWSVRGLAPTRLRLAGAAVGFLAGASAALVYCLHCPEMAAPFVALWYVAGIALPTAMGTALGPRLLRW
ncbi:MAG: NrsF family protein [Gammaproteobacteria bacterium]